MSDRPLVYLTRQIPDEAVTRLQRQCDVVTWEEPRPPPHDTLVAQLEDHRADALFCTLEDTVDAPVMDASPALRCVGTMSVGYDHVDLAAAAERDIAVGHTPGVLTETTADLTWALLMTAARRVVEANRHVHEGAWGPWGPTVLLGRDVHGSTLGIVGLGSIGTAVARRTAGFEMDVCYAHTGPHEEAEASLERHGVDAEHREFEDVVERADYLSLHVPLNEDTESLVGEAELRRMKDAAVLINTARGAVVDTAALDTALAEGWIRHAALDVTDPEPMPPTHPLLRHAPERLTVTPHIGSASTETRTEMAVTTAENILGALDGTGPTHSALADAGYV